MSRVPPARTDATSRPHRVLVFTTPSCPWCIRAKQYLRQRNVKFREVDLARDPAAARDLVRRTSQMGVPVEKQSVTASGIVLPDTAKEKPQREQRGRERGRSWAAYAACAWALAFAVPSFYWAAGGAVGSETIAADVDELGLSDPWLLAGTGIGKVLVGVVALALVQSWGRAIPRRLLLGAAWSAAALLIVYAVANFVDHGLMEASVRNISEALGADAVRWHLLLWDPWWLLGGVLFAVAAWQYQSRLRYRYAETAWR